MPFVSLAERFSVIGIRTVIHFHKVRYRLVLVAEKLSSADVYHAVATMANGDDLFEFLDFVLLVVTPPFVRF